MPHSNVTITVEFGTDRYAEIDLRHDRLFLSLLPESGEKPEDWEGQVSRSVRNDLVAGITPMIEDIAGFIRDALEAPFTQETLDPTSEV